MGRDSLLQAGDAVLHPLDGSAAWAGRDRGVGAGLRETRVVLRLRWRQDLLRVALQTHLQGLERGEMSQGQMVNVVLEWQVVRHTSLQGVLGF